MKPEEVKIDSEFVILFEDCVDDDERREARFEKLSNEIGKLIDKHGFKKRAEGTEQQMRLMLVDRAKFISESNDYIKRLEKL